MSKSQAREKTLNQTFYCIFNGNKFNDNLNQKIFKNLDKSRMNIKFIFKNIFGKIDASNFIKIVQFLIMK
jgi:hypothetical protein